MSDDFSITVNGRIVEDQVYLFRTSGGRLGLAIEGLDGSAASTYLTPDEWDAVRTQGDRIATRLRLREKASDTNSD